MVPVRPHFRLKRIDRMLIFVFQFLETYQNIPVPASAFSNGKGSYSIPQLSLKTGTTFILTMSDATGFGSGGTTNQLVVGSAVENNECNITVASPPYMFNLEPSQLTQCG